MKNILTIVLFGFILILTESNCKKEIINISSTDNEIYYRDGFVLSYNERHEQPNWVFYKLYPSDFTCTEKAKRKNNFKEDLNISTGSASLNDYKGSGYDRGHLKPSADEKCDQEQMDETFLMSNMSPQVPSFNRGIWKNLETHVRNNAKTCDSVYIYTGGVLEANLPTIGENEVSVPRMYFKVVHYFKKEASNSIVYLLPNDKLDGTYDEYVISINHLEKISNIDFPTLRENRLPLINH